MQHQAKSDKQIARVLNVAGPASVITAFGTLSQSVQLQEGQLFRLTGNSSKEVAGLSKQPQDDSPTANSPMLVHCTNIAAVLASHHNLVVTDTLLELEITNKDTAKQQAQVKVVTAGALTVGQHIQDAAVPSQSVAELTAADSKAVHEFVSRHFVEYVAAPIKSLADVASLRQALDSAEGSAVQILARIEDVKALPDLDKLLQQVAGVYISRQGLTSHLQPHELPQLQKLLISRAKLAGRLSICSADLFITSHAQAKASPAEVADLTNAVLDGCDCVALSVQQAHIPDASLRHLQASDSNSSWCTNDGVEGGRALPESESPTRKSGTYARPSSTLKAAMLAMSSVLQCAEGALNASAMLSYLKEQAAKPLPAVYTAAISAVSTALDCHACLIVTLSHSPLLSMAIAVGRPPVPQMLITDSKATARLCSPAFGVYDLLVDDLHDISGLVAQARVIAQEAGLWNGRDAVVIVREDSAGVPLISIQN